MIRSSSEAICETIGYRNHEPTLWQPKYFNIEMFLRFNLGPIYLMENFVTEILAHDTSKIYIRKKGEVNRSGTKNLNKSATMGSYEENPEKYLVFQALFGNNN